MKENGLGIKCSDDFRTPFHRCFPVPGIAEILQDEAHFGPLVYNIDCATSWTGLTDSDEKELWIIQSKFLDILHFCVSRGLSDALNRFTRQVVSQEPRLTSKNPVRDEVFPFSKQLLEDRLLALIRTYHKEKGEPDDARARLIRLFLASVDCLSSSKPEHGAPNHIALALRMTCCKAGLTLEAAWLPDTVKFDWSLAGQEDYYEGQEIVIKPEYVSEGPLRRPPLPDEVEYSIEEPFAWLRWDTATYSFRGIIPIGILSPVQRYFDVLRLTLLATFSQGIIGLSGQPMKLVKSIRAVVLLKIRPAQIVNLNRESQELRNAPRRDTPITSKLGLSGPAASFYRSYKLDSLASDHAARAKHYETMAKQYQDAEHYYNHLSAHESYERDSSVLKVEYAFRTRPSDSQSHCRQADGMEYTQDEFAFEIGPLVLGGMVSKEREDASSRLRVGLTTIAPLGYSPPLHAQMTGKPAALASCQCQSHRSTMMLATSGHSQYGHWEHQMTPDRRTSPKLNSDGSLALQFPDQHLGHSFRLAVPRRLAASSTPPSYYNLANYSASWSPLCNSSRSRTLPSQHLKQFLSPAVPKVSNVGHLGDLSDREGFEAHLKAPFRSESSSHIEFQKNEHSKLSLPSSDYHSSSSESNPVTAPCSDVLGDLEDSNTNSATSSSTSSNQTTIGPPPSLVVKVRLSRDEEISEKKAIQESLDEMTLRKMAHTDFNPVFDSIFIESSRPSSSLGNGQSSRDGSQDDSIVSDD